MERHDTSILRISYCSTDTTHNNVFAFIATNKNETLECHAFAAQHRKMAQAATLTIAQVDFLKIILSGRLFLL